MADAPAPSLAALERDPRLFLYTSLTAGSSHIITATSRLETILRANRIPYTAVDLATDENARRLWQRRAAGKKLPGLVKEGFVLGDLNEVEEWNEFEELHENIGPVPPADYVPPAEAVQTGVTLAPPSIGPNKVSGPSGASPKEMVRPAVKEPADVGRSSVDSSKGIALPGADEIAARHKAAAEAAAAAKAAASAPAPKSVAAEKSNPQPEVVVSKPEEKTETQDKVQPSHVPETNDEGDDEDDDEEVQEAPKKAEDTRLASGVQNLNITSATEKPLSASTPSEKPSTAPPPAVESTSSPTLDEKTPSTPAVAPELPPPPSATKESPPEPPTAPAPTETKPSTAPAKKSPFRSSGKKTKVPRVQDTSDTDGEEESSSSSPEAP